VLQPGLIRRLHLGATALLVIGEQMGRLVDKRIRLL